MDRKVSDAICSDLIHKIQEEIAATQKEAEMQSPSWQTSYHARIRGLNAAITIIKAYQEDVLHLMYKP